MIFCHSLCTSGPISFISRSSLVNQTFSACDNVRYELADGSVWNGASVKRGFAGQTRPQVTVWSFIGRYFLKFAGGGISIEVEPVRMSRTRANSQSVVSGTLPVDQFGSLGALSQTEAECTA